MRAVLLIVAKDLRLRIRDRSMFVIAILAPFGLAFILGTVIGETEDLSATYAVVDEDGGELPRTFADVLESVDALDVELVSGLTRQEAADRIDGENLDAAFIFPPGFSEAVTSPGGGTPDGAGESEEGRIVVMGNVDQQVATQVATAIADGFAYRVNAVRLSVATVLAAEGSAPGTGDLDTLIQEASERTSPVTVSETDTQDRQLDDSTHMMAGLSVMFLFFTVLFGVMGMFEERDKGTLARLQAAPIRRSSMVVAKALGSVIIGTGAMAVLIVGSTLVMGADWGDPLAVAVLAVAAVLAAVSIMGVVAAAAKRSEQAFALQGMIAMVLAIIGGSFFPVARGEGLLATISSITPHHWFLRGLGDALVGGVGEVLVPVAALLAFAVVFGGAGALLLAWRAEA